MSQETIPDEIRKLFQKGDVWHKFLKERDDIEGGNREGKIDKIIEKYLVICNNELKIPAADRVSLAGARRRSEDFGSGQNGFHFRIASQKNAGPVEAIRWVAQNIEKEITQDLINSAPCMEAVGMLFSYSQDDKRKSKFWDSVYTKLVPSSRNIDTDVEVEFDGSRIVEMTNEILEMAKDE